MGMQTLSRLIREAVIIRNIEVWKCLQHQMTVLATVSWYICKVIARQTLWRCTQAFCPEGVEPNILTTGTCSMLVPSSGA